MGKVKSMGMTMHASAVQLLSRVESSKRVRSRNAGHDDLAAGARRWRGGRAAERTAAVGGVSIVTGSAAGVEAARAKRLQGRGRSKGTRREPARRLASSAASAKAAAP